MSFGARGVGEAQVEVVVGEGESVGECQLIAQLVGEGDRNRVVQLQGVGERFVEIGTTQFNGNVVGEEERVGESGEVLTEGSEGVAEDDRITQPQEPGAGQGGGVSERFEIIADNGGQTGGNEGGIG